MCAILVPATCRRIAAKVMTDQELADVYAYVQSVPPPVPLADIPILKLHSP